MASTCRYVLLSLLVTSNLSSFFFFFLMIRRPPRSPLFPSTTALPISVVVPVGLGGKVVERPAVAARPAAAAAATPGLHRWLGLRLRRVRKRRGVGRSTRRGRHGGSEEHTSELQSPCNLVCRLLLEKKK